MVAKARKRKALAAGADFWFVRLPDGRVLRSRNTETVREHLKAGRISWASRIRRSSADPWRPVSRLAEFKDLVPVTNNKKAAPPRKKETEVRTGVRGLLEELFNAFDVGLRKNKLMTTAVSGLLMGVSIILGLTAHQMIPSGWQWLALPATAFVMCVIFSTCTSILTKLTAFEAGHRRPATFQDIRGGLIGAIVRLTFALTLMGGVIGGLIFVFHSLPGWLTPADNGDMDVWLEMLLNGVSATSLMLEVICWPLLGFAMLLLGPILVVEECSVFRAFLNWVGMLRQHLGRIYLYQSLAFASAAVLTLPPIAPIWLAFGFARGNPLTMSVGEAIPFFLLMGVAVAPTVSYLLVAHVFIYLNLRYEFYYSARKAE